MPCYDSRSDDREYDSLLRQHDELANMLCGLCRRVDVGSAHELLIEPDPALAVWWKEHQARDERKQRAADAERLRARIAAKARAKLTPQELEALGIRN